METTEGDELSPEDCMEPDVQAEQTAESPPTRGAGLGQARWAYGVVGLFLLACAGGGPLPIDDDEYNAKPLAPFAQKVMDKAGVSLSVDRCAMFSGTRAGYCLLSGEPARAAALQQHYGGAPLPVDELMYRNSCLSLDGFGHALQAGWALDSGTVGRWRPSPGLLPPNTDNIQVDAIWVNGGHVCMQVQFPYG